MSDRWRENIKIYLTSIRRQFFQIICATGEVSMEWALINGLCIHHLVQDF